MTNVELLKQARAATLAARAAQEQIEDEWSVYRSLARVRMDVGTRLQEALGNGEQDVEARHEYAALLPELEAQRQVLYEAMADLEKSETELRAAYDAAFGSQAEG